MTISTLTMAEYQALPALSVGGAFTLSELCPALYWAESPFNPDALPRKNTKEFDIGTAVHLAVLEPDSYADRVTHIPYEKYATLDSRELRDRAYDEGRTPLKLSEVELVNSLRDALYKRTDVLSLFRNGHAEQSITWEMNGVPCKCRPDYMAEDYILDLKTVRCAHPKALSLAAMQDGWHVRVPWYIEGSFEGIVEQLRGVNMHYLFVCIEKQPPHLIEVYELDQRAIEWGRAIIRRALRLFRECRKRGEWPGYSDHWPTTLRLPAFAEFALAEREAAGEFTEIVP